MGGFPERAAATTGRLLSKWARCPVLRSFPIPESVMGGAVGGAGQGGMARSPGTWEEGKTGGQTKIYKRRTFTRSDSSGVLHLTSKTGNRLQTMCGEW